jgi:hypothetical protein
MGYIPMSAQGSRINKWAVWSYGSGQSAYKQAMLVDVNKPLDQVTVISHLPVYYN